MEARGVEAQKTTETVLNRGSVARGLCCRKGGKGLAAKVVRHVEDEACVCAEVLDRTGGVVRGRYDVEEPFDEGLDGVAVREDGVLVGGRDVPRGVDGVFGSHGGDLTGMGFAEREFGLRVGTWNYIGFKV